MARQTDCSRNSSSPGFPITVGGSTWRAQKLQQVRMREARIRSLVRVASSVGPKEAS